jgi:hypothetical protein
MRMDDKISTRIISMIGLRSNIPSGGTTLRIGLRKGETTLSKVYRTGFDGCKKYDNRESMITRKINKFASILIIFAT